MPRCRKILANGKRCKAHAIAGSKFCLFHTPGQKMKRGNKDSTKSSVSGRSTKDVVRTSVENQLAVRSTRKGGSMLVLGAVQYNNAPDYTHVRTKMPARVNRQGTVYVSAHERRVIEPTRSDWGRNFKQTDNPKRKRSQARTRLNTGRLIPYLGIGYMAYNMGANWGTPSVEKRDKMEGFYLYDMAVAGEFVVRNTVKAGIVNTLTGGLFSVGDLFD